jgi:hypothetical protein
MSMGQVIEVDFNRRGRTMPNPYWQQFLLMMSEQGLDDEDITAITNAVRDPRAYAEEEDHIRMIADVWLEHWE